MRGCKGTTIADRIGYAKYIVKAKINGYPYYFDSDNPETITENLISLGYKNIEVREIVNRDRQIEGILKRCRTGGKTENYYLCLYFYNQPE